MTEKGTHQIPLTAKERENVKRIAERDGISADEAATNLVKAELAYRARKRGGATSRIVPIRKR